MLFLRIKMGESWHCGAKCYHLHGRILYQRAVCVQAAVLWIQLPAKALRKVTEDGYVLGLLPKSGTRKESWL